jgi:Ser/Thr protein kinase RdoA (MazF antagonist)
VIAEEVAAAFGLGKPVAAMTEAARGWGGHNIVYRLDTTDGRWTIKALLREVDELIRERFDIELAAFTGGVRMPQPVPAVGGSPYAELGGTRLRCHEWVDGVAKVNEETSVDESRRMGRLVAGLHGMSLGYSPRLDERLKPPDEPTWEGLADGASRQGASWAATLTEQVTTLERLSEQARKLGVQQRNMPRIASHRDLNAHNVLFAARGLWLIDWEAAGPIYPGWERANYACQWAARPDGRYDLDAAEAFLDGYQHAGGVVTRDDPDTLAFLLDNVASWTKKNVMWAITRPSAEQDLHAGYLIGALLATPSRVEERRRLLHAAITRLRPAL